LYADRGLPGTGRRRDAGAFRPAAMIQTADGDVWAINPDVRVRFPPKARYDAASDMMHLPDLVTNGVAPGREETVACYISGNGLRALRRPSRGEPKDVPADFVRHRTATVRLVPLIVKETSCFYLIPNLFAKICFWSVSILSAGRSGKHRKRRNFRFRTCADRAARSTSDIPASSGADEVIVDVGIEH